MERGCQDQDHRKGNEVSANDGGGSARASGAGDIVIGKKGARVKLKGPIQETWSHGEKSGVNGWKCGYCSKSQASGGKTCFTQHLAGLRGDAKPCEKVPAYVRSILLDEHAKDKKQKLDTQEHRLYVEKALMAETYEGYRRSTIPRDEAGQIEWALRESLRTSGCSPPLGRSGSNTPPLGRASSSTPPLGRASQTTINKFYRSPSVSQAPIDIDLARSKAPTQLRVDVMMQGSDHKVRLGKALAKWFHSDDIPGRKADNPYFIAAN